MAQFRYRLRGADGSLQVQSGEAQSAGELARRLIDNGLRPLQIEQVDATEPADAGAGLWATRKRVTLDERILLSRQLASLTRAGISIVRAIRGLAESSPNPHLRDVLLAVADRLQGGADLASSLADHPRVFDELYVALVHVGENTGRLDEAFSRLSGYLEMERETRRRMKSATRYPTFVLAAMGVALGIINLFVIPAFAKVFEGFHAELPWQTRALVAFSEFCVDWWAILLGATVGAVYAFRYWRATARGGIQWDRWKLHFPVVGGIFERIVMGRFCQTFAMVMKSGVPVTQGLSIVGAALGNKFMARRVGDMRQGIERGESISHTARASGLFTPVVLQMLAVGEETGNIDELLTRAAEFYEEETDYLLGRMGDAIEPILVIGIGVLVLVLALGVFLPLWDLSSVAR